MLLSELKDKLARKPRPVANPERAGRSHYHRNVTTHFYPERSDWPRAGTAESAFTQSLRFSAERNGRRVSPATPKVVSEEKPLSETQIFLEAIDEASSRQACLNCTGCPLCHHEPVHTAGEILEQIENGSAKFVGYPGGTIKRFHYD
jgi:hypothetical protein